VWLWKSPTYVYHCVWALTRCHVLQHGPIPQARMFTKINSRLYSASSLLFIFIALSLNHQDFAKRLYHFSKFWEYVDVLGVRASGWIIDLHFGFHHLVTPYMTFFRILHNSEGWLSMALPNAFHHVLMYAFFGGVSFLQPILPITGSIQLLFGLGMDIRLLARKIVSGAEPIWPHFFGTELLGVLLTLWIRDLGIRARSGPAAAA
jgi:hypothetical protein